MKKFMFPLLCSVASILSLPVSAQNGWLGESSIAALLKSKAEKEIQVGDIISFSTFDRERLSAQSNLPCKWVTLPHNQTAGYDFLCKGGTWATVSYMLDRSTLDTKALGRARLLWRSWHPDAHPSGGEAHAVQPFLTHTLASLVPVSISNEVEYAFWQAEPREWVTEHVTIRYTYDYRADHGLHKLEITGHAPKLGMMTHDARLQPQPRSAPIPAMPQPQSQGQYGGATSFESVHQEPAYKVAPVQPQRGGPEFMQEESVPSVQTELPQGMIDAAIAAPNSLEDMAEKSRQPHPANTYQGTSRGHSVPAYEDFEMKPQEETIDTKPLGIPTLQKPQDRLDLGTALDIPNPPGSLVPYGDDTLNSDSLLEEAGRIVPDSSLEGTSLKNNLLKDYFEAEETTERYRDRAEGRVMEPLREDIIAE